MDRENRDRPIVRPRPVLRQIAGNRLEMTQGGPGSRALKPAPGPQVII